VYFIVRNFRGKKISRLQKTAIYFSFSRLGKFDRFRGWSLLFFLFSRVKMFFYDFNLISGFVFLSYFTILRNLISRFREKTAKPRNFLPAKVSDNEVVHSLCFLTLMQSASVQPHLKRQIYVKFKINASHSIRVKNIASGGLAWINRLL